MKHTRTRNGAGVFFEPRGGAGARRSRRISVPSPALLALLLFLAGGCSTTEPESLSRFEFNEPHMGTLFSITLYARDAQSAQAGARAAFQRVAELEHVMSDYDTNSELMQLLRRPAGEPAPVSRDLFRVLETSARVSRETGGAYDITVGPYVRAWRAARQTRTLPTAGEIEKLRQVVGWQKVRLDARRQTVTLTVPGMQLDLGGIGKGFAADEALAVLRHLGINRALVAASGDIAIGDPPPGRNGWKVGVAPMDGAPGEWKQLVELRNAGISTSGDTEQFVELNGVRYSHIMDPATGLGLTNRIQATIIGPNATVTDGLDTPLGILGVERALALVDARPELAALISIKQGNGVKVIPSREYRKRWMSGQRSQNER